MAREPNRTTRRQLLRLMGVAGAASLVAACAPAAPAPPTAAPAPAAAPPAPPTTAPASAPPAKPAAAPKPTEAPATQPVAQPAARVPAPPSPRPTTPDKVRYGLVAYNPFHWIIMIAQVKKTMEPYGIDLDILLTQNAPAAVQALAAGSVDAVTTSPFSGWQVQQKSPDFKQFMEIVSGNPYTVVVQPEIRSYQDLKGKTIAGQSLTSGPDIEMLRILLGENGLQYPRDYDIQAIGSSGQRVVALKANQVAAAAVNPPDTFMLIEEGKRPLDQGWKHPFFKDTTSVTLIGNQKWFNEKRAVVIRFIQGYVATTVWLYDPKNKEESIKILADLLKMDPKYAQMTYDQYVVDMKAFPLPPRTDQKRMEQTFETVKKLGGAIPENVMALVDNSLVDEAMKSSS